MTLDLSASELSVVLIAVEIESATWKALASTEGGDDETQATFRRIAGEREALTRRLWDASWRGA